MNYLETQRRNRQIAREQEKEPVPACTRIKSTDALSHVDDSSKKNVDKIVPTLKYQFHTADQRIDNLRNYINDRKK